MARKGRAAGRGSFIFLGLLTTLIAVLAPPGGARASGEPGGSGAPPAPPPLSIPASWYDTEPGAPVDYLPASSGVTPSGQFTLSIPIDTPPARGMGPSLSLSYASTTANGLVGVGWSIGGLSEISRCRKTIAGNGANEAIHYTLTDDFCLDGQRLVLVNAAYSPGCKEYRTERDTFARIVGCGDTLSGPADFEVRTKGGEIRTYEGLTSSGAMSVTVAWPLRDAQDRSGNVVRYRYDVHQDEGGPEGDGFYYRPREIEYTRRAAEPPSMVEEAGQRMVIFDYEPRPDPSSRYLGGIRYGMPDRLSAVTLKAPNPDVPEVVARYELSYEESASTGRSLLKEVRRCDREAGPDRACLWAKQLTWWQAERPDFEDADVWTDQVLAPEVAFFAVLDANGDGKDDLLAQVGYHDVSDLDPAIYLFRGSADPDDHGFLPPILVNDPYVYPATSFQYVNLALSRPADVDGDGSFELLAYVSPPQDEPPYEPGFQWFRWSEDDLAFEPFGDFLEADGQHGAQLVDLEGDGLIDLLRAEPPPATPPRWLLHKNAGGDLSDFEATAMWAFEPGRAIGIDLDGNGRGELFSVDPVNAQDSSLLQPLGIDDAGQFGPLGQTWVVPSQGQLSIPPSFADVNGDGLRDALYLLQDPKQVRLNTGQTFRPKAAIAVTGQLIDTSVADNGVRVADFDGDGREDLLSLEAVDEVREHVMRLWLARPGGFVARELGFLSGYKAPEAGWATTKLGDFNGDGWLDVVRMPTVTSSSEGGTTTGNLRVNVLLQQAPPPAGAVSDLLFEVKDEHSPVVRQSVFYTTDWSEGAGAQGAAPPACTYPQLCLRRGFPVVRMVASSGIEPAATRWTMYGYEDPRADLRGHGFLGFGAVRAFDPQLRAEIRTTFDHHTRIGENYPFAGLPRHTTQIVPLYELPTDGSDFPPMPQSPLRGHVTSIDRTYTHTPLNGGATYFAPVTSWSRTEFETDVAVSTTGVEILSPNSAEERRTEGTMQWDGFGNLTYDFAFTWGGSARLVQYAHDNLTDDWHIGLLRQTLESAGALGALPSPREVTFDYDARGRLWRTTVEPNDPALFQRTTYHRNGDGLVDTIWRSAPGETTRATYFAYDDKERMFLRAAWNDLGHYRRMATHPALGLPIVTEDENGVRVRRRYDTFGRVLEILPDGGAPAAITYAADTRADAAHPHGLAITEKSAGGETTTYVDDRGRAHESATLAFDGQTIVHRTDYNAFGQPVRAHRPGFGAASALFTETTFDTLGRPVAVERPNGDRAETDYGMFEIVRWDFRDHPSTMRLDQEGRVVESTRFLMLDLPITTTYAYGDFGLLTDVRDDDDNHTAIGYDRLGRRTRLDDPDKGVTTYQYNGFGELEATGDDDPATPQIKLYRDILGRVEARTDAGGTTTYEYDAPGALGKPWKATSPDGVQVVYSYDGFGRPWKTTWTLATAGGAGIGDGTYEIERAYDGFGRLSEIQYPEVPNCGGCERFAARYTYTPTGYLHAVEDARPGASQVVLWEVAERNADDLLVQSRWAPGIAAPGNEPPEETRGYDPVLGRLGSLVTTAHGGEIFHLEYGYDPNGNVTSRDDLVTDRGEAFGYDALDRLKSWTLTAGGAPRELGYAYDALDNLLTVTEDGTPVLEHTYGEPVPGGTKIRPHALRTLSGAVAQSYHYDARGRQIEGGNRGITWTDFDLPKQITSPEGVTRFDYDALGARTRKTRLEAGLPVAATVTLGGLYERVEDTQQGSVEHVFYVVAEGGAVAQITYSEGTDKETARYLQRDALGSVALVFDEAGVVHDRRFFEPFGQRIEADGSPFSGGMAGVELGFTGHRHDGELGLIDMKGRVYDPVQKHFLSPDPVIGAPLSGQDLNRYSYAWNNPLSVTDPTGLQEQPDQGSWPRIPAFPLPDPAQIAKWFRELLSPPPPPTQPASQKTDSTGASGATGPTAQPAPQSKPPASPQTKTASEDKYDGFAPYDRDAQRKGGFVAGVALGAVPVAPIVVHVLINTGVMVPTPEFREEMAKGEMVGGLLSVLWGSTKGPSAAPAEAPRPVPAATGGSGAPPLSVVPDAVGVVAGAGGIVNIAVAAQELAVALSSGGGGDDGPKGVRVGEEPWRAFEPGEKACQNGCEAVAEAIQKAIGGQVKVITGPGRFLGRVRNSAGDFVNPAGDKAAGWSSHHVVLKDGIVYDALTGPNGMPASAYKQLWEYGDVLNFGF